LDLDAKIAVLLAQAKGKGIGGVPIFLAALDVGKKPNQSTTMVSFERK